MFLWNADSLSKDYIILYPEAGTFNECDQVNDLGCH
jgi:hypothetical protein